MPPNFVVGRCWRPLRASRREDWQIEHPGRGRDAPACHCHPHTGRRAGPGAETGARWTGAPGRCEPSLAPPGLGPALHGAAWAVDGVGCVLQSRAQRRPPWGGEPRLPSRFLGVQPAPHALARGRANGRRDVGCHAASARAQRHRCRRAWHGARQPGRTGAARPSNVAGSLWRAGRRPKPTRAVGPSVRLRLVVLSKPSVRAPRTRDAGAGARAARGHAP